ncbi:MAG TPA: tetratricopeptide repeat protein, partial [Hyphomicrobiaceae bacterium]|nr:tetratricopeptide repeat protein [Hyphomicrobiaceae bacterium]
MITFRSRRNISSIVVAAIIAVAAIWPVTQAIAAGENAGLAKAREAAAALAGGQLTTAVELYTEALKDKRLTNDRQGVIFADRGVVLARLNQPAKAIADFNQAVTLFAEYAPAYNNRGAFLVSLGAFNEAVKDFDRAIVLAPGYVAAWNNRAGANVKLKRYDAAIEDFTRAIRLAPGIAEPLIGRGHLYLMQSRPLMALRDIERAIRNDAR